MDVVNLRYECFQKNGDGKGKRTEAEQEKKKKNEKKEVSSRIASSHVTNTYSNFRQTDTSRPQLANISAINIPFNNAR